MWSRRAWPRGNRRRSRRAALRFPMRVDPSAGSLLIVGARLVAAPILHQPQSLPRRLWAPPTRSINQTKGGLQAISGDWRTSGRVRPAPVSLLAADFLRAAVA